MDRYAQVINGVVVNVIESATDPDGVNGNWIYCEDVSPGWRYDSTTGEFSPPEPLTSTPSTENKWAWYIDHGPFADRLGPVASFNIDTSASPALVAIRSDFARRKWIDLKDVRVRQAVQYLAGLPHPVFGTINTPFIDANSIAEILDVIPSESENLALRRLYFS